MNLKSGLITRQRIDARLKHITSNGYFGDHKMLAEGLLELRWRNGRRVYYSIIEKIGLKSNEFVLILLGGLKNEQKKDIQKAKRILKRYLF